MAETLLPAWSQQGSSLPRSWNGNSLHGQDTLAQGAVWRLGETRTSLQPHRDMNLPQLQIPVHSATLLSLSGNGPGLSSPQSLSQQASKTATGWFPPVQLSQDWCLQGTVFLWGKTRGRWPLSRLSPTQDKVLCVGDATCHLHSHHAQPQSCPTWPLPGTSGAPVPGRVRHTCPCEGRRAALAQGPGWC